MLRSWLLSLTILTLGCAKSLPIEIHIDKTFSDEDRTIINEAITEWNVVTRERLPDRKEIFIIGDDAEPLRTADDFNNTRSDFYHADYKKFVPPQLSPGEIFGYTTMTDILLYSDFIRYIYTFVPVEDPPGMPNDERRDLIVHNIIKKVTLHELGHLLGLSHYFHREGIMVPGVPPSVTTVEGPHLSQADLDAFCILYECPDASFRN